MKNLVFLAIVSISVACSGSPEARIGGECRPIPVVLVPCSTDSDCEEKNILDTDSEEVKEIKRHMLYL